MDKESEFLSFPTIYWADNKDRMTPVHYSTIYKWHNHYQASKHLLIIKKVKN